MKKRKILFYIDTPWPNDEQKRQAESVGAAFRNVRYFDRPEQCEGVMGTVPDGYDSALIIDAENQQPEPPAKRKRGRPSKND